MNAFTAIRFHYLFPSFTFPNRTKVKGFLYELCRKEGKAVDQLNYIFCDDHYLLEINRQYLQHDTYTDIITFPLSSKNAPLLSDIYISIPRVKENAKQFQTTFQKELHRVLFHGALHLCGYKDKSPADSKRMRAKEEEYLRRYFVPRGTLPS
ncbi:MAG TPA: rRNA maturation RNase YbeY [Chitinophagaceae bacterium]|jgi:rRNA maturation RNase YbeY|nr:rRNA maturation RNase YbeY [Chitinophagaceae bacterium]